MRKKKKQGQPGLTLENIEKPLIHFASPRPRKPLNHLKMLSPSPKTIEVFGKPPPVPFPCYRGGDREGDPFIQCPLSSSLIHIVSFDVTTINKLLNYNMFFKINTTNIDNSLPTLYKTLTISWCSNEEQNKCIQ
jgi:hypothetical protein